MSTEPNNKRPRRSLEERQAALQEELARLSGMKRRSLGKTMESAIQTLRVIAESTTIEGDPIRDDCRGLAVRMEGWIKENVK